MYSQIAQEIEKFGGYLKCEVCGREKPLGNTAGHLASGWPMCYGYSMRWITKNELEKKSN